MSFNKTPVTQRIQSLIFLMYVAIIQCLNFNGQDFKKQFTLYSSVTPVTLKQGQSHQMWYEFVDPKQGFH